MRLSIRLPDCAHRLSSKSLPTQSHPRLFGIRNPLRPNGLTVLHNTENLQGVFDQNRYVFFGLFLHSFGGAFPAFRMTFQPFRELLRRQDPDTGSVLLSPVTALKRRAKGSRIVCEEGCLQYILTVLQFQIVVVYKTAVAVDVIDVLIHQHAGTELRLVMFSGKALRMESRSSPARNRERSASSRRGIIPGRETASQPSGVISTTAAWLLSENASPGTVCTGSRTAAAYCRSWMAAFSADRTASSRI